MKKLFIVFLLLANLQAFSQHKYYYLGLHKSQVMDEIFLDMDVNNVTSDLYPDGSAIFNWSSKKWDIRYELLCGKDGISYMYRFYTKNTKIVNTLIKKYNQEFVPTSTKKWKYYIDEKVIKVDYYYLENSKKYFFAFY